MPASLPWWHPASFACRRPHLEIRARLQAEIRAFFEARGYFEVETPAVQVSPGSEPHLFAFATEWQKPDGERAPRYLHTSPELAMKKLLVAGSGPIFQFARVWRNGEASATHAPEFTLLEWYRPGADYRELIGECHALLALAAKAAGRDGLLRWQGQTANPAEMTVLTVAEAFARYAGIDLMATLSPAGLPDTEVLRRAVSAAGMRSDPGDRWDDLFFRVVLEKIEPYLGRPHPTALCDYPLPLGALARAKPEDRRLVDRFELYVAGLELANAFGELCDVEEQARRFEDFAEEKRQRYGFTYPTDEDFLAALRHGMPTSAGIALGFDRLVMLASGAERIEDVLWAPVR